MDKASEAILALKPVTFHYKSDAKNTPCFGLIAEEVAEVNPELVLRDKNGEILSVRYDQVNAMLLNEFLKEHKKVEQLKNEFQATVAQQQKEIQVLTAQLKEQAAQIQRVSAQIEVSRPAPKVVLNNP
jgi:ribosomal protein L16 Arg81 hydroxylase